MSDSSTNVRVEGVEAALDRVLSKLDRIDERMGDLREVVAGLRSAVDNVRALVDGAHARATEVERDTKALELRILKLENEAAEQRGATRPSVALTAGTSAMGGGVIAGLIELVRRFVE